MKSKLIQIPYTIGIIKPHLVLREDKMEEIYQKLDENHFEVFHSEKKILTKEEVLNLFFQYRNAPFFPEIEEHMMTAESEVLLLVNKVDSLPAEEEGDEDIKLESPIIRWKKLLGDKDPEEARKEQPESIRATYGLSLIKNGFWGSDDAKAANKERDVFLFPIPERPPEFEYIRTKVTLEMIFSFLFPPNLEHANSTGRLDLFAMYGPVVNYHSVDYCFCKSCTPIAKEQLVLAIKEKEAADRKKLGITGTEATLNSTKTMAKAPNQGGLSVRKLKDAPTRLLKEVDINAIYSDLCPSCQAHCDGFVHLTCGRGGQHANSDIEIDEMIREINKNDLLQLLTVEKGSTAKMMIETVDLTDPAEIMYKEEHVRELLKNLETDYYERYEFDELQKMIIEDRRLRMNYWISKITKKPIEKFKNPNLLNQNANVNRDDIKNPYFTLKRILPISVHMEKTKVIRVDDGYDKRHFEHSMRLHQNEQDQIIERQVGKDFHRVAEIADCKKSSVAGNTLILRNYNDGRSGGWDNYACYKGINKGSHVQKKQTKRDTGEEEIKTNE